METLRQHVFEIDRGRPEWVCRVCGLPLTAAVHVGWHRDEPGAVRVQGTAVPDKRGSK